MSYKIMFICTGNTCRSPMAAAMAAEIFTKAGLVAEILSAGVSAWPNQPASHHAISAMEEDGLCLVTHKSTLVSDTLLTEASLVLTMTDHHKTVLLSDHPSAKDKIYTLGEYAGEDTDISDPYGGSLEEYRACASQIRKMLLCIVEKLG